MKALGQFFLSQWDNPPAPFNPAYNPAGLTVEQAAQQLEAEEYYDTHTREECAKRIHHLVTAGA